MIDKNRITCKGFYHFAFLIRKHKSVLEIHISFNCDLCSNDENDIYLFKKAMNYLKELNNINALNISSIIFDSNFIMQIQD